MIWLARPAAPHLASMHGNLDYCPEKKEKKKREEREERMGEGGRERRGRRRKKKRGKGENRAKTVSYV